MKKFNHLDGMDNTKSTLEERQEIYKMLYHKGMILAQKGVPLYKKLESLDDKGFYFSGSAFLPNHDGGIKINHISFEEFKNRLALC